MPRIYLPLLPLPVLAIVVAVSACTKARTEETTHLIPPAQPYVALAATPEAKPPEPPATESKPDAKPTPADEEKPSAQEVKEFERPVRK